MTLLSRNGVGVRLSLPIGGGLTYYLKILKTIVEIWCLTLYLFRRLGELTLIVPCYFGHSSVNLGYKIAL